jgi:hypothetical protein
MTLEDVSIIIMLNLLLLTIVVGSFLLISAWKKRGEGKDDPIFGGSSRKEY